MQTLSEADHQRIAHAIRDAEGKTSGEIVCVLARSSDSYFHPAAVVLGIGLLAVSLAVAVFLDRSWLVIALWQFVLVQILAYAAILAVIAAFPDLRILFVPRRLRYRRAHRNAVTQFLGRNIHVTDQRTGVLIFLSLAERYAEVVADAGINARVPQSAWDEIVSHLVEHAAAGRIADGFAGAIAEAGALLAREFPRGGSDSNELDDHLVEI